MKIGLLYINVVSNCMIFFLLYLYLLVFYGKYFSVFVNALNAILILHSGNKTQRGVVFRHSVLKKKIGRCVGSEDSVKLIIF